MKTIDPGHTYELAPEDINSSRVAGESHFIQELRFVKKEDVNGVFKTVQEGTTNEEVLAVLIDRIGVLNTKLPSRESSLAITKLQEGLMWLNQRTAERKDRGVENTPLK